MNDNKYYRPGPNQRRILAETAQSNAFIEHLRVREQAYRDVLSLCETTVQLCIDLMHGEEYVEYLRQKVAARIASGNTKK